MQNYLAGTFVLQNSSRGGIINQLEFVDLHGLPDDYLRELRRSGQRGDAGAGPADGAEVHRRTTRPRSWSSGDRKVIEEQVKPYGR